MLMKENLKLFLFIGLFCISLTVRVLQSPYALHTLSLAPISANTTTPTTPTPNLTPSSIATNATTTPTHTPPGMLPSPALPANLTAHNMTRMNTGCLSLESCLFYQVDETLSNYGCSFCNTGYHLQSDLSGAGLCKLSNPIPHCLWTESRTDLYQNRSFCWQCEKNYTLSEDFSTCTPKNTFSSIPNCESYFNINGQDFCNACTEGFTVSSDGTYCEQGCNIQNCDYCQKVYGQYYCIRCKPNFIGVYDSNVNYFTDCLSCSEWQMTHLAPSILRNFSPNDINSMLFGPLSMPGF